MDFGKIEILEDVKLKLSKDLSSGSLSHALLLTGANGGTREKTAHQIAAALLCTGEKLKPCKKCPSCIKIFAGTHPDISTTEGSDKKKSIKIDAVRAIREKAYILPNEAQYKFYIILEADGMGEEAQNALLKIIEEPPAFTRFILCAASKDAFLPTILSRVTHYNLAPLTPERANAKADAKLSEVTDKILENLTKGGKFDLILSTAQLDKDRSLFKKCVEALVSYFRDALCDIYSTPAINENTVAIKKLRSNFTKEQLLYKIDALNLLREDCDKNANENLLLTRLQILLLNNE